MKTMWRLVLAIVGIIALSSCMSLGPEELTSCVNACKLHDGPSTVRMNAFTRKVTCGCLDGATVEPETYGGEPM